MNGFGVSRGAVCAVLAAAALAVPSVAAHAAIAPTVSVSMGGSMLNAAHAASVGCRQVAQANLKNPDGTPVSSGSVDFFSHLDGQAGNMVGSVPVVNGTAEVPWVPDVAGQHVISAIYHDNGSDYQPAAGSVTVSVVDLGGACL